MRCSRPVTPLPRKYELNWKGVLKIRELKKYNSQNLFFLTQWSVHKMHIIITRSPVFSCKVFGLFLGRNLRPLIPACYRWCLWLQYENPNGLRGKKMILGLGAISCSSMQETTRFSLKYDWELRLSRRKKRNTC